MALWSLFREIDIEEIARQLVPCVWTITRHPAVHDYFADFRGRLVGPPSAEHAQQLLDFIENRKSDEEFIRRIRQVLNREELKGILRTDSIAPASSVTLNRSTYQHPDEQERQTRELQKIANWFSPLNFKASHIDHLQKRHGDSGKWFLERQEFKDWCDGGPGMLWCPGNPGAGKTVLSAIIIDHLRTVYKDDDVSITWIYCNYKDKAEQTLSSLIGSLIKQMVQNKSSISNNIKMLYERHNLEETRPPSRELEQATSLEFTTYSNAFIVVDAVDECPEDTGTQAELLRVLQTFSRTVKVLVTSRDVPTISQWFEGQKMIRIHARDEDIRKYVQGRIDGTRQRHLKSLESEIANRVAERAEGMFLLAWLFMDLIVMKVSHAGVRKALEDMPRAIDEIYANALKRIREQDGDRRHLGEQVLKWITFAFRPLSLEELQEALAIVLESTQLNQETIIDEEILTSACAGLVSVDKGSIDEEKWGDYEMHRSVRLIHYTAQSYFERTKIVHFPGAHTDIAKACIIYLSQEKFLGVQAPNYPSLRDLMEHHHLLHYASRSWGDHVQEQSDEECNEMVHEFLADERNYLLPGQILHQGYLNMWKGFSGIHLSAYFGLGHIIKDQLLNGAKPSQTDNQGQTPLVLGAIRGHEKVMMPSNVTPNLTDEDGRTPLLIAVKNGHVKVVELLLTRPDVKINLADMLGITPLIMAATLGHMKIVEMLLEHPNLDINFADINGKTPLIIAATSGHVEMVEMLLEHPNVDINSANKFGMTSLHMAAGGGHLKVVELLLKQYNVEVNLAGDTGWTPLFNAAQWGKANVVELLLTQPNVDINLTDEDGLTPLLAAAKYGHVNVVELLLKQSNIAGNLTNEFHTAKQGHTKFVKLLYDGLDLEVHLMDNNHLTPLYLAAENGHRKVVEFLLHQSNVATDDFQPSNASGNVLQKLDVSLTYKLQYERYVPDLLSRLHTLVSNVIPDETSYVLCVCFSADGNFLATGCNCTVQIYDIKTGMKTCDLGDNDASVACLCFSPDGRYLAAGGEHGRDHGLIWVWDIACKSIWRILDLEGHESAVSSIDFSQDGRFIVSGSWDGKVRIWDMKTGKKHKTFCTEHEGGFCAVAISPDGQLVATGSRNVDIWNTQSGELIESLDHSYRTVSSVAFTPDGKGLVSGGNDRKVKLWDMSPLLHGPSVFIPPSEPCDCSKCEQSEKGSVSAVTFMGHKEYVSSVAVSQDGRWVVSGSSDGSVRFWDLHTGQTELLLWGHDQRVNSVHLSPTGGLLATASDDGWVKLWRYTWGKRKGVADEDERRVKLRVD